MLPVVRRRWFRAAFLLLLLALFAVAAGRGWAAYQLAAARREADAHHPKQAWRHLERARLTWPFRADDHLLAARVARRLGRNDRALAHLEAHRALGGDPDARAFEMNLVLAQEGDLEGREQQLLDMVESGRPESTDVLEALARGYATKNHQAGLGRLLRFWPDHLVTSCWRGKAHLYLGEYAEAVADLTPFVDEDPDTDDLRLDLAQACYRAGRPAEGLMHYRHLQRRRPSSPDVLMGLALCMQDQSLLDEAAAVLDRRLEQEPDDLSALVERGRVAFRQGRYEQGERWARRAIEVQATAPDAYLILALCLEAQGRHDEARRRQEHWQELDAAQYHLAQIMPRVRRNPDNVELHFQLASIFLLLGDEAMAREAWENALRLDPDHRATHRLLADHYARLGQSEQAEEHRRRATAPDPQPEPRKP